MRAFWQLYLANFKEFIRDRMSMFWVLAFPLFFIVLFGVLFSNNSGPSYDLGLADEDQGRVGTAVTQALGAVEIFEVQAGEREALVAQVEAGELDVVVVVPAGTSAAVEAGASMPVQAYYDPSNQAIGQLVLGVIEQLVAGIDREITQRPTLLTVERQSVLPQQVSQLDFILPGVLGMALMQIGLFGTATVMVQLREQQVLRRLAATPLSRTALLASQVAFRLTLAIVQTGLILGLGLFVFRVSVVGSLWVLVGFVLLGALAFIALGYLVSSVARTVDSANGLTQAINFPMMFLSGLFFPISLMPAWIRPVTHLLPLTYLADALRQIMFSAPPVYPLALDLAVLGAWLLACTALSVRLFKWD